MSITNSGGITFSRKMDLYYGRRFNERIGDSNLLIVQGEGLDIIKSVSQMIPSNASEIIDIGEDGC
jgi:hypothetical protein